MAGLGWWRVFTKPPLVRSSAGPVQGCSHARGELASAGTGPDDRELNPLPRIARPNVWAAAGTRWKAKHLNDAVMAASKAVNAMLQGKVARDDLSEVKLVQAAFSMDPPAVGERRLRFPAVKGEQTRTAVTVGAMNFGVGCFMAMRDPIGHLTDDQHELTEQEALEQLAAWSLFARWIDRAEVAGDKEGEAHTSPNLAH